MWWIFRKPSAPLDPDTCTPYTSPFKLSRARCVITNEPVSEIWFWASSPQKLVENLTYSAKELCLKETFIISGVERTICAGVTYHQRGNSAIFRPLNQLEQPLCTCLSSMSTAVCVCCVWKAKVTYLASLSCHFTSHPKTHTRIVPSYKITWYRPLGLLHYK